jgi:hypothetical protein
MDIVHQNGPADKSDIDARSPRPALVELLTAMARLSRTKRNEIARFGRRAPAAKIPRIRRLVRHAVAESRAARAVNDGEAGA